MSDPVINVRALSAPGVFAPGHLGLFTAQVPPRRRRCGPGRDRPGRAARSPASGTGGGLPAAGRGVGREHGMAAGLGPARAGDPLAGGRAVQPTVLGVGYPAVRIVAMVACGIRSLIDALFGPTTTEEVAMPRAGPLATTRDAGPGRSELLHTERGRRSRGQRCPVAVPVQDRGQRGAPAARAGLRGRVLAGLARTDPGVSRRCEPHRDSAQRDHADRVLPVDHQAPGPGRGARGGLYHQRWQIETAYCELRSTILGGRVLRAKTRPASPRRSTPCRPANQILRTAMTHATNCQHQPGPLAPDRASLTIALLAARDQIVTARRCLDEAEIHLIGLIGAGVLADLLPDPRPRTRQHIRNRAISKYNARGPAIDHKTYPI